MKNSMEISPSPYHKAKLKIAVSLSPSYIQDMKRGVQEQLNQYIMKYSEGVQGVIVAMNHPKLDDPHAKILQESPFLHCKVRVEALVFQPIVGSILKGKVNKLGSSNIGMLVSGVFNASIASSMIPDGYKFSYQEGHWYKHSNKSKSSAEFEVPDTIEVGAEVSFRVVHVREARGIISIVGSLRPEKQGLEKAQSLSLQQTPTSKQKRVKVAAIPVLETDDLTEAEEVPQSSSAQKAAKTPSKRKRSKADSSTKVEDEVEEEEVKALKTPSKRKRTKAPESQQEDTDKTTAKQGKSVKKKKKSKDAPAQVEVNEAEVKQDKTPKSSKKSKKKKKSE